MTTRNLHKPDAVLASPESVLNLKILTFEREDWSLFRTVEGLQQRAGVPLNILASLVMKEITDNGLDTGTKVDIGKLPRGGYFVEDQGPGINGTPEQIAALFSINRPMVSTKLLRLPTRGAVGNGLRVVAGAVLVSSGSLVVITRNRRIVLRPERDGTSTVVSVKPFKRPVGTRIEIKLDQVIPCGDNALLSSMLAIRLAPLGSSYAGKTSPYWYDGATFHELLYAGGSRPLRELVSQLDGCAGGTAGKIVAEARLGRTCCKDVTRSQAERLLTVARDTANPVRAERLGAVGPDAFPSSAYARSSGLAEFGGAEPLAHIPVVVEAWAAKAWSDTRLSVCINRTPITGEISAARDKRDIDAYGCGLSHNLTAAPKDAEFAIVLNIGTPYMPIASEGKAPNLLPFLDEIQEAVGKAVKKAHRQNTRGVSQKDVVLDNLDAVIAEVSGDGEYRFNSRQLFYALRPIVMDKLGVELKLTNFTGIIDDYETENGEIEGMYREPRGSIYHPHRRETITLGTLMVENYKRPSWLFNKLVYIEKEGFGEALKEARWPERNDTMLMSSKGFSTRAAKDLVDKLAEHDEPVTIFCVHDADASGTMIYQTLQEATRARRARKIQIVDLGLQPWEAIEMELAVEDVKVKVKEGEEPRRKPVAAYVLDRTDLAPDDTAWEDWLQTHRIELNAMTTPAFIEWLDGKMADQVKLVPPPEVLTAELDTLIEEKVREDITEQILREAGLEARVAEAIAAIDKPSAANLAEGIGLLFTAEPDREWRDHIKTAMEAATSLRIGTAP
jgi:hypothetical protein